MMKSLRQSVLCMAVLIGTASSQAGELEDKLNAMLDKTLAEWTVLVSCTALDPQMQAVLGKAWADSTAKTVALLKEKGADSRLISAVGERMAGLKPVVTKEAPASELIAFCHSHPDWHRKLLTFEITKPEDAIKAALGGVK
jgi:hypothetical protein